MLKQFIILLFLFSFCESFSQKENDSLLNEYLASGLLVDYANKAHRISYDFYKKRNYKKAIEYALKEVKFKKHLSLKKQKNSLFNLGLFFFKNEEYSKSIETYNKVIDSFSINEKTYRAYCENARNYMRLGDYYSAKNYFKKGLINPDKIASKRLIGIYLNYIILNDEIESEISLKENSKILKKVDSLSRIVDFTKENFYNFNNEYAVYYTKINNYIKSRDYSLKVFNRANLEKDSIRIVLSSNNLGRLYNKQKSDSALFYLNKGIVFSNKTNELLLKVYLNKAEFFYNKNNVKKALENLNVALKLVLPKTKDTSKIDSPSFKSILLSSNKFMVFNILKEKSKYLLRNNVASKDNEITKMGYNNVMLLDKLLDFLRLESIDSRSKLFWQKEASIIYELAVEACYKLNKPDRAFYFIEKNKALLLLENINKNSKSIPIVLLQKELDLKKEIYNIENKLKLENNKTLQDKYYTLKIEFKDFIESLKEKYPSYYNFKKPVDIMSLDYIQNSLDEDSVVLEYIIGEANSYVLAISKKEIILKKLSSSEKLKEAINFLTTYMAKPFIDKIDIENYKEKTNTLYEDLFPQAVDSILKNKRKLLIIPDHTLQNLPFESLKNKDKYLIEDYEISYAYSLSFLEKNKNIVRNAKKTFLAFAPKTFNYDNLQTLSRSETEVEIINKELNGEVLLDTAASKNNFFSKIEDYKIVHLSTHANANDSIAPWIAFKNKKLYLNELYTTKTQAELVMLNACNSSLGKINNGEGVFSLARGFFYSGANSVVSSLWNVNDKSNAEITTSFYSYLKDGKTKSAALRQAKLDYLNTHTLSEASPYYWSSLILIGDDTSMFFNYNYLLYIGIALLFLVFSYFLLKKIKLKGN